MRTPLSGIRAGEHGSLYMWNRFCELRVGVHDTSDNLEKGLRDNDPEVSPSTIFALASIDEGVSLIVIIIGCFSCLYIHIYCFHISNFC